MNTVHLAKLQDSRIPIPAMNPDPENWSSSTTTDNEIISFINQNQENPLTRVTVIKNRNSNGEEYFTVTSLFRTGEKSRDSYSTLGIAAQRAEDIINAAPTDIKIKEKSEASEKGINPCKAVITQKTV